MTREAIEHYEAALKEAFPRGATGDVFHHWNEARKALEQQPSMRPATREEKIVNPGVYEVIDTESRYKDVIEEVRKVWSEHRVKRAEEAYEAAKQRGWRWVPLEPTQEMIDAIPTKPHVTRPNGWGDRNAAIYQAMVLAAPKQDWKNHG